MLALQPDAAELQYFIDRLQSVLDRENKRASPSSGAATGQDSKGTNELDALAEQAAKEMTNLRLGQKEKDT